VIVVRVAKAKLATCHLMGPVLFKFRSVKAKIERPSRHQSLGAPIYRNNCGILFPTLRIGTIEIAFNASVCTDADQPLSTLKITALDKHSQIHNDE
jgi:hypothetical protein